jgi:hypothetical protein
MGQLEMALLDHHLVTALSLADPEVLGQHLAVDLSLDREDPTIL